MKAKHIAFLSLSVIAGTFASCTGSHEIKITGSVKNLDGGTIIYQKSIDGMFNSQSQDTLKLNTDSTFSLTLPSNGYEQILQPRIPSPFWKARMKRTWRYQG